MPDLIVTLGADIKQMQAQMGQANGLVNKFSGSIANAAKGLATAFAIKEIGTAAFDLSLLAARAEGVERAFNRLPGATLLLREMKKETAGAVSELELMQRAVQFNKFGLNLEELPKLLKFAALTAQETGQDVNFLVDSIVTGLGRKSVLILDNLGLSASRIKEEVEKTGDFVKGVGKIVDEELPKMGDIMDNNATAVKNTNAALEDTKLLMGKLINESGLLQSALSGINNILHEITRDPVEETAALTKEFKKLRQEAAAKGDIDAWIMYNNLVQQGADKLKKFVEVSKSANTSKGGGGGGTGLRNRSAVDLFQLSDRTVGVDSPELQISATAEAMNALTQAQLANNIATLEGQAAWSEMKLILEQNMIIASQMGDLLGAALGDAITGQQTQLQALRNLTADIVQLYGKQAILAAISKAAQGAPPGPFAILAAGAAAAAMSRIVRSFGGGGSSGGAGGGGVSSQAQAQRLTPINVNTGSRQEVQISFSGDAGKALKAMTKKQDRIDNRTKVG